MKEIFVIFLFIVIYLGSLFIAYKFAQNECYWLAFFVLLITGSVKIKYKY